VKKFLVLAGLLAFTASASAADHPGSDAKCAKCHSVGNTAAGAPAVSPEQPGFFAKLFGAKKLAGHPSVSCAGEVRPDGTLSGCHRPEDGGKSYLVMDIADRPVDILCAKCHADQTKPGAHHPSYKADDNQDGVAETIVRPAPSQEIYTQWVPSVRPEPLKRFPDALAFRSLPDGSRVLEVALPLATVVEPNPAGEPVTERDVVTCSTCHNPHFGYLAGVASEEELNQEQVAREKGDALLRLRDTTNALCEACH